jgi:hypothetical protein
MHLPVLTLALLSLLPLGGLQDAAPKPETRWVTYKGKEGPGKGKHIVLIAGDEEYRSEEAMPMLGKLLSQRHGFKCTVLFSQDQDTGIIDPENQNYIPGLEALASADMAVVFLRFRNLPDDDMRHFVDFVKAGKPIFGIRTATHAFAMPDDSLSEFKHWRYNSRIWSGGFGRQILGETWRTHHGHHGSEATRGIIPVASRKHPILRGVQDVFGLTDVYGVPDLPIDATVLLEGSIRAGMEEDSPEVADKRNQPRHPIAWTRELPVEGKPAQRIVCSTIGASIDLKCEDLRRLFVNSCYWCCGLEEQIGKRSKADLVGTYEPTMFGFGSYVKGVKVIDHAWPKKPMPR